MDSSPGRSRSRSLTCQPGDMWDDEELVPLPPISLKAAAGRKILLGFLMGKMGSTKDAYKEKRASAIVQKRQHDISLQ